MEEYKNIIDEICEIIFEEGSTEIGRQITLERIKERIDYENWLLK